MKTLTLFAGLVLCAASVARADVVVTTPAVGYQKLVARGASDTRLSLPLVKRPVLTARIAAVGTSSITLSTAALADGAFAPNASGSYYAQFVAGNLAGLCFPILGNTSGVFSLDAQGDDLTNHSLGSLTTGIQGDVVRIRPFWRVADVLGNDAASLLLDAVASLPTGPYLTGDAVLLSDTNSLGTDKKPAASLYYLSGYGWRSKDQPSADAAFTPLPPGRPFKVRRHNPLPAEILLVGDAPSEPFRLRIPALIAGQDMDVEVALAGSIPTTLGLSGLFSSVSEQTVFNASASTLNPVDLLMKFDTDRQGFSLPSAHRYHVVGTDWFDVTTLASGDGLLPGEGYVLRLRGERNTRYWLQPSSN